MRGILRRTAAVLAAACLLAACGGGGDEETFPDPTGFVVDAAGALSAGTRETVEARLAEYERRTGNEVAVAVVSTTGGRSIEDYAEQLFDHWGVGKEDRDNGALVVVAMKDRRLRIEVGYGLEERLTDVESGRVVNDRMVPRLRSGDVDGAVTAGVAGVVAAIDGDAAPGPVPTEPAGARQGARPSGGGGFGFLGFLLPMLFVSTLVGSLSRRSRHRRGHYDATGSMLPWIIMSGSHHGYGGGSTGSTGSTGGSGGFGGFGGGGSGGGGASGGW